MASDNTQEIAELEESSQLKSVSSDGESISIDTGAAKARLRHLRNTDLTNIANGRVRPVVSRIRING